MESENKSFFRFTAEKVSIQQLEEGEYIEDKEHNPNYITIGENRKIFRINVMATLVNKELRGSVTSILIDDGTGKIVLRLFEENKSAMDLEVGDVVQIIGKIRIFNQEKYIFPEIIKKINSAWLKVRHLELQRIIKKNEVKKVNRVFLEDKNEIKKETVLLKKTAEENINHFEIDMVQRNAQSISGSPRLETQNEHSDLFCVINEEIEENDPLLPYEKISKLIIQLDKGDGVMIEDILEKSPLEKTEELIEKMLENGEIFQNMPGKVKLL